MKSLGCGAEVAFNRGRFTPTSLRLCRNGVEIMAAFKGHSVRFSHAAYTQGNASLQNCMWTSELQDSAANAVWDSHVLLKSLSVPLGL